jgi:peroxiredoxin
LISGETSPFYSYKPSLSSFILGVMSSFNQRLMPLTGQGSGARQDTILPAGSLAPQFSLCVTPNQTLSHNELLGRPVILAFYPADWSPVCGDQMALYNEVLPEFTRYGAALVGISVDGVWCHAAFALVRNLHFPLAADFEPKGHVALVYRAYREADGTAERALFVIDKNGIITWSYLSPLAVNPSADGILEALDKLGGKTMS